MHMLRMRIGCKVSLAEDMRNWMLKEREKEEVNTVVSSSQWNGNARLKQAVVVSGSQMN